MECYETCNPQRLISECVELVLQMQLIDLLFKVELSQNAYRFNINP